MNTVSNRPVVKTIAKTKVVLVWTGSVMVFRGIFIGCVVAIPTDSLEWVKLSRVGYYIGMVSRTKQTFVLLLPLFLHKTVQFKEK